MHVRCPNAFPCRNARGGNGYFGPLVSAVPDSVRPAAVVYYEYIRGKSCYSVPDITTHAPDFGFGGWMA